MKNITKINESSLAKVLLLFTIFFTSQIFSQVQQNGIMHVGDNTIFYVAPGASTVNFGSGSSTTTSRTANTYGKIQFANGLSITSPDPAKVNGYVSSLSGSTFFAPTGSTALRRVINFSDITNNTNGIDVAYFEANPITSIGATLTSPVEAVTNLEYFNVRNTGASAKIEYSWEASNNIATLTNNKPKNVALVGYNGTSWVEIPSVNVGNVTNGSVTSSNALLLSNFQFYSLGVITGHIATLNCTPTITGTLAVGGAASGVSAEFSYTGGNGRSYDGQSFTSTGVTGLTATLSAGDFTTSTGTVTFNISGTPNATGTATFNISVDGKNCTLNINVAAALISTINCGGATNVGVITSGTVLSGITSDIPYTGGNGGLHAGQTVTSTGVLGLTATLAAGNFATGSGTLLYTISGTTQDSGNAYFAINIGGRTCTLVRSVVCRALIASTGNMKTWNGSWSPSSPTINDPVTIDAPYANGGFRCNSIVLNQDITLTDNQTLEVEHGITTSTGKKIIMSSRANLIQRNEASTAPTIQLTKETRSIRRNDYTYFGTPISGNFLTQMGTAKSATGTWLNALDGFYRWQAGDAAGWQRLTMTETGKGFIAKVANQPPFSSLAVNERISFVLNGTANNGNITVPIIKSTNVDSDFFGNFNLIANPYPSAINADKFLEENTNIDGVVYIWVANQQTGTGVNYEQSDYIAYTKMGSTAPGGGIQNVFDGNIPSGQGFVVKALSSGNVTFTNCIRLSEGEPNNLFFKTSAPKSTPEIDRFKLNLTNDTGVFSQILIGYLSNCTTNYDRMYDASRNSAASTILFSYLDNGQQLAINARPSFTKDDIVPLGINKTATTTESLKLSIVEKEGVFNDPSVDVFLHDSFLNTYHNFKNGDYVFTTNSTFLASRFKIMYTDATLSNSTYDTVNLVGYIKGGVLNISSKKSFSSIEIYDISGKNIETFKTNDTNIIARPFNKAESIYIVKVKFTDGAISTLKLTNEK